MRFRVKLIRAENYVDALWARNPVGLWHALNRLIVPLFKSEARSTILLTIGIFFILFEPFLIASIMILIQITSIFTNLLMVVNNSLYIVDSCLLHYPVQVWPFPKKFIWIWFSARVHNNHIQFS